MSLDQTRLKNVNETSTSEKYDYFDYPPKPIEMYVFINPLCLESWQFEPYLKKLSMEYGRFFTIRPIISSSGNHNNKFEKAKNRWNNLTRQPEMDLVGKLDKTTTNPWIVSLAIKAAEIQGKKSGKTFLRKLQEHFFMKKSDISNEDTLINIAKESNLDLEEFYEDLHSSTAKKAIQCDVKITFEMEIDYTPTIVFFNHSNEDQGIKISGLYPYEVYEYILQETLKIIPIPSEKPPLEEFISKIGVVRSKEISIIYDWPLPKTEKEMKKLQFKQKVIRIHEGNDTFWKYNV